MFKNGLKPLKNMVYQMLSTILHFPHHSKCLYILLILERMKIVSQLLIEAGANQQIKDKQGKFQKNLS